MLLHEPEKNLFLSGFIVKNPHAERKRDDSHPHGAAMNGKFGECVMIGIVQEPGNHAFLGKKSAGSYRRRGIHRVSCGAFWQAVRCRSLSRDRHVWKNSFSPFCHGNASWHRYRDGMWCRADSAPGNRRCRLRQCPGLQRDERRP